MATLADIEASLRALALSYPGAEEEFPWGDRVFKVRKKIFAFINLVGRELHVTVKLPESGGMALALPGVEPTRYNLGRSGWVTATYSRASDVPVPVLREWMDESYRAVAPKKLVKERMAGRGEPAPRVPRKAKRT